VADSDGYFRRINPQWQETLGYTTEELTTNSFFDFIHPGDVEATKGALARLANGKSELHFVNRYRTRSGGLRWLEWRALPRGDLIYAAARDLTERIDVWAS
jgi:PAS domain S-box-containing protein